jgi:hypothetical protein
MGTNVVYKVVVLVLEVTNKTCYFVFIYLIIISRINLESSARTFDRCTHSHNHSLRLILFIEFANPFRELQSLQLRISDTTLFYFFYSFCDYEFLSIPNSCTHCTPLL